MKRVLIGTYVNTHGIRGEIKILSKFPYKNQYFQKGKKIIIEDNEYIVSNYRIHKQFDMLCFDNITNINQIEFLKGKQIFGNREDLILEKDEYYIDELINFNVMMEDKFLGKVIRTDNNNIQDILVLDSKIYIPYVKEWIKKIDTNKKIINIYEIGDRKSVV